MSFAEFTNQVYTPSAATITITDNTDFSYNGVSSKLLKWVAGTNETATLVFDSVDLSGYEEISFQAHMTDLFATSTVFKITINGNEYLYNKFERRGWNHLLIDCRSLGATTTIVITSLVPNLTLFIDYIGYRKVTHERDTDVLDAFKSKISLDYDQSTTLTADVAAGASTVALAQKYYTYDHSFIELDNGAGIKEQVQLLSRNGTLIKSLVNAFSSGNTVKAICPTLGDEHTDVEPDPICGVTFFDRTPDKRLDMVQTNTKMKRKMYTGTLGVLVYINCTSERKLLQLSREYDFKYGERFQILLDGEKVDIILENSTYVTDLIGNKPRATYFYRIEPGSYFVKASEYISNPVVVVQSEAPEVAYDSSLQDTDVIA